MGKYLDILERTDKYDINDINDKRGVPVAPAVERRTFGRLNRLCRTLSSLEARCPELVAIDDWQQAVADARTFLTRWGEQESLAGRQRTCSGSSRSL